MLATAVSSLFHTPPAVLSLNVIVRPAQTAVMPVIDAGKGFTVIAVVLMQPVGSI
jgi:hypothetical protein